MENVLLTGANSAKFDMRVAVITVLFPCQSETFVLSQIIGLLDRGVDVQIYAREKSADATLPEGIRKYNLNQRTKYYGTDSVSKPKYKLHRFLNALIIFLKSKKSIKYFLIKSLNYKKFGRRKLSLQDFYNVYAFSKLEIDKFDIVHCQFGTLGKIFSVLKQVGMIKCKLITSFHGYDLSVYLNQAGYHSYSQLFQSGDLFLPISDYWESRLISLGCPMDKILVHRMGVDIKKLHFQKRLKNIRRK